MPLEHIGFTHHQLLDAKHIVIVTYFFRRNSLSPHSVTVCTHGDFIVLPYWETRPSEPDITLSHSVKLS